MSPTFTSTVLVVSLITQLGSPTYRDRERAQCLLTQMAPLAVPYLEAARKNPDVEIARRSRIILVHYYQTAADRLVSQVRPSHWPHTPWLDMLPADYPDRQHIVSFYLSQAQQQAGQGRPPEWSDYRLATTLYLKHLIMEEHKMDEMQVLLDRMAEQEQQWLRQNGQRYSPPISLPVAAKRQ